MWTPRELRLVQYPVRPQHPHPLGSKCSGTAMANSNRSAPNTMLTIGTARTTPSAHIHHFIYHPKKLRSDFHQISSKIIRPPPLPSSLFHPMSQKRMNTKMPNGHHSSRTAPHPRRGHGHPPRQESGSPGRWGRDCILSPPGIRKRTQSRPSVLGSLRLGRWGWARPSHRNVDSGPTRQRIGDPIHQVPSP